jgi:hypothetical protein
MTTMKPWLRWPWILALAGVLSGMPAGAADPPAADSEDTDALSRSAVVDATRATDQWLAAVDAGRFADTWKDAAEVFRLGATQEDWIKDLAAIRAQLGPTTTRELKSAKYSTRLRGAPATGQYVSITYLTKFANAPPTIEALVVSREQDGEWRISGYYIGTAPAEQQ